MTRSEFAAMTKKEGDLFRQAQAAYRARQISDEDFLAARKRYIEYMDSTDALMDDLRE